MLFGCHYGLVLIVCSGLIKWVFSSSYFNQLNGWKILVLFFRRTFSNIKFLKVSLLKLFLDESEYICWKFGFSNFLSKPKFAMWPNQFMVNGKTFPGYAIRFWTFEIFFPNPFSVYCKTFPNSHNLLSLSLKSFSKLRNLFSV